MNKLSKRILYIILFLSLFLLIQAVVQYAGALCYSLAGHGSVNGLLEGMVSGRQGELLAITTVFGSLITIAVFQAAKWCPMSRNYLRTRPWGVFFWTACLALGTILPFEWIYEQIQIALPKQMEQLFESLMKEPWGYAAIGLLAPIAEEVVFRGAILRKLLGIFGSHQHWYAIIVSALLFGCIHGNVAQGSHAFIIGLILGWLFYRTDSILPGVVFHWVNNSVAFAMYHIMPQMNDGKLVDLFHGDNRMMMLGIVFSLCIMIPALLQLYLRMKPDKK